jgi:hypothetical protein
MGTKTLFQFSQTSATILANDTLLKNPTTAATIPPMIKIY